MNSIGEQIVNEEQKIYLDGELVEEVDCEMWDSALGKVTVVSIEPQLEWAIRIRSHQGTMDVRKADGSNGYVRTLFWAPIDMSPPKRPKEKQCLRGEPVGMMNPKKLEELYQAASDAAAAYVRAADAARDAAVAVYVRAADAARTATHDVRAAHVVADVAARAADAARTATHAVRAAHVVADVAARAADAARTATHAVRAAHVVADVAARAADAARAYADAADAAVKTGEVEE